MSEVEPWLREQAARLARLPSLEDALLGAKPLHYVAYRLRYVYLRALLRCVFRLLELGLFAQVMPLELFGLLLVVRSAMLVADGLLWGALETLRRDVRRLARESRLPAASRVIRRWLAHASLFGGLAICSAVGWVSLGHALGAPRPVFGPSTFAGLGFADVFVLGCAVRWALEALMRTYHSGVYALKRIYRPLWSLLLVDFADIASLLLLFWWLGPWGAGVSLVVVGVLRVVVAWRFTSRVYRHLRLDAGGPRAWFRARSRGGGSPRESVLTALGNLVGQVDALLVLGLLSAPGYVEGASLLAALFHVVAPLQSAALTWARLFYFDFKRLEAWGAPFLLQRFEVLLARVAWLAALPVGGITFALMSVLWRGPYLLLALELTCLALVRSWLSLRHVRAYSLADQRFLRRLFFGMLVVTASTPLLATFAPEFALGALVLLAALGLLLLGRSELPLALQRKQALLGASVWLGALLQQRGPVRLGLARVDRRLSSLGRLARSVAPHLTRATVGRLNSDTLVWFEVDPEEQHPQLLVAACGTIKELCIAQSHANGPAALSAGLHHRTWQRCLGAAVQAAPTTDPAEESASGMAELLRNLHEQLRTVRGELRVIELSRIQSEAPAAAGSARALRQALLDAARGRSGFHRVGEQEVIVLAPAGAPCALVFAPVCTASGASSWRASTAALVQRAEIALTLRGYR